MSYYRECPNCKAHLDPGEVCDCERTPATEAGQPSAAQVRRHTTADLFNATIEAARAAGLLAELDPILDYAEPSLGAQPISNFEFETLFLLRFGGSEGIYIDASIRGVWQEGGTESQRGIGTIKTLREDRAAMLTMGQVVGALTWCARDYIDSNIDDFAPAATLAHWQRQRAERAAAKEARGDADRN